MAAMFSQCVPSIVDHRHFSNEAPELHWFPQSDVISLLKASPQVNTEGLICVYENSISYVGDLVLETVLLTAANAQKELSHFDWDGSWAHVRKLYHRDAGSFLCRSIIEFGGLKRVLDIEDLNNGCSSYTQPGLGLVARRVVSHSDVVRRTSIYISANLLSCFSKHLRARVVQVVHSNRFSDRSLDCFGQFDGERIHDRNGQFCYELEFRARHRDKSRPLLPSMSFIDGKRDISSDIWESGDVA